MQGGRRCLYLSCPSSEWSLDRLLLVATVSSLCFNHWLVHLITSNSKIEKQVIWSFTLLSRSCSAAHCSIAIVVRGWLSGGYATFQSYIKVNDRFLRQSQLGCTSSLPLLLNFFPAPPSSRLFLRVARQLPQGRLRVYFRNNTRQVG